MENTASVRWGLIGTSGFAENIFAPAIQQAGQTIVGAAGSAPEHSDAFAARHGCTHVYGEVEDLLADSDIDAVWVASPNYLHEPHIAAALTSGNYDVAIDFNNTVSVDPNEVLVKFIPGSPNNYSGADDKVLVDLFNKQADIADPAERKKVVRQFLERLMDESYFIPLFGNNRATAAVKEFKGWKLAPTTVLNLDMSDVWFDR